ncbi:hypothetical protein [Rhizobium mesoamericanum]|uniref:hypothetical protein n=1 Tax=Rhizobium mesoamericanum TaxID=1079800 RepID=UPI0005928F17|nr:hypothetical protein [Rhizobium mesoamericanum]
MAILRSLQAFATGEGRPRDHALAFDGTFGDQIGRAAIDTVNLASSAARAVVISILVFSQMSEAVDG